MTDPVWIARDLVVRLHGELVDEYGGLNGIRDEALLESALGRPQNQYAYGSKQLSDLAASYAFGIARNHPFLDGNKRVALAVCDVFLQLNGFELTANEIVTAAMFLDLAAGTVDEPTLARWIADNSAIMTTTDIE